MNELVQAMFEIYPRFSECTIQTFDDNKERKDQKLASKIVNKEENYSKIAELNSKGAGIFFSVNPMIEGKRDKESVIGISSWICEIDGMDKELQKKLIDNCPLKPSIIIESNSSYHLYRFSKDGTKEKRNDICNGLRNYFDGDPAVVDISRVLRLPGYNHIKDEKSPYPITILEIGGDCFTEYQMQLAYPNKQSLSDIKQSLIIKDSQAKKDIGGDYYWDRVKNMNTVSMLEEISGTQFVNNEVISFHKNNNGTEQIIVNGKSTGCWIDKNGKIGSSVGGGPNWTNWVFWYGNCNGKELAQRINDKHPEMVIQKTVPKKDKPKDVVVENKTDIDFTTVTPFTRGLDVLDERFGRFCLNQFIVTIGESQSGKTEFTFFQARQNAKLGYKVCYIGLEMTKKNMILRICQKRAGVTKKEWDNKTISQSQKEIMREKYNELWDYPNLDIIYIAKPTIEDIKTTIKEKQIEGYELFYIDNMGFVVGDIPEIELTAFISRELKELTNTQPISINLLHHFNKGNSKDRVGPRGMASMRSSGKIENDADYVVQVWRDLDDDIPPEDRKIVGIYLQKDRVRGDPSNCKIEFDRGDYVHKQDTKQDNNLPF